VGCDAVYIARREGDASAGFFLILLFHSEDRSYYVLRNVRLFIYGATNQRTVFFIATAVRKSIRHVIIASPLLKH
jgi:hypothetical protein